MVGVSLCLDDQSLDKLTLTFNAQSHALSEEQVSDYKHVFSLFVSNCHHP